MPLNENALVDLDTMKNWLGIDLLNTDFDFKIELFINSASKKIETYLNRKLSKRQYTVRKDGVRSAKIVLRHYPVGTVTSLSLSNDWDFTETVDTANYIFSEDGVITLRELVAGRGNANIQVVYEAGYVTPLSPIQTGEALPSDIEMACITFVKWLWNIDHDERMGIQSRDKQNQNTTYINGIPKEVCDMIEDHRRVEVTSEHAVIEMF